MSRWERERIRSRELLELHLSVRKGSILRLLLKLFHTRSVRLCTTSRLTTVSAHLEACSARDLTHHKIAKDCDKPEENSM